MFHYTFSGPFLPDHSRLVEENKAVLSFTCGAWCSLLGDSPFDVKPNHVIHKFCKRLENDTRTTIRLFAQLASDLSNSVRLDGNGGIIIDSFINEFSDTPVFREYLIFTRTGSIRAFAFLMSFLSFGKKMAFVDADLDTRALRSWHEVEARIGGVDFDNQLVRNIAHVMWAIFSDFQASVPYPKHGSGAVAERQIWGIARKNEELYREGVDPKINLLFWDKHDVYPYGVPPPPGGVRQATSRLTFVPKDWKKTRSICMEPIGYQYAQQCVRLWFEDHIETSLLRKHVFIEDQTVNQRACWHGSISGRVDTIDLSSASDSVSLDLVKRIFPPTVLKWLLGTRSRAVELPDGTILQVNKFAPMGSALCFPTQCAVYGAVVIATAIANLHDRDVRTESITEFNVKAHYQVCFGAATRHWDPAFHPFYIYGDDIICDSKITSSVIHALTMLGFEVNEGKSYLGESAYRESCGKHYLNGFDVTPFVLKTKWFDGKVGADSISSMIDAANLAYDYGYLSLRRYLINYILYCPLKGASKIRKQGTRNPVLFTTDRDMSCAIFSDNTRNRHLPSRNFLDKNGQPRRGRGTHIAYQRDEVSSIDVRAKDVEELSEKHDNYSYVVWWRGRRNGGIPQDSSGSFRADQRGKRLRQRWTAA